jgi:DMSO/TMAO reductase YedYZ molybdopterin-dependent catalytic subunit
MQNKKILLALGTVALLAMGLIACGGGAPEVEWDLAVSGAVDNPQELAYSDLAGMPQTELEDILMEKTTGEDVVGSWSGVALTEILEQAGAAAGFASITAIASDGYAIEIPTEELQDAIVALQENGEWIAEADPDHGPIRVVAPHTPANRWVFQLQEIVVNESVQASGGIPDNAALKITGSVESEIGWAGDKLRSMDTIDAEYTGKDGETKTYTGIAINDLLDTAGPAAEATMLVLVADDGYSAEVTLAEVQACADCIVAFDDAGFRSVLPGLSGKAQVKGLVEIQVK